MKYSSEAVGAEPQSMVPVVGFWRIENDNGKKVLAVDGRQWKEGQSSAGIADKARALYGERYAEFLDLASEAAWRNGDVRSSRAIDAGMRSLSIRERVLGPEHLDVGKSLIALLMSTSSRVVQYQAYLHFAAYYEVQRGGRARYNFAETPWTPVRYRPGTRATTSTSCRRRTSLYW